MRVAVIALLLLLGATPLAASVTCVARDALIELGPIPASARMANRHAHVAVNCRNTSNQAVHGVVMISLQGDRAHRFLDSVDGQERLRIRLGIEPVTEGDERHGIGCLRVVLRPNDRRVIRVPVRLSVRIQGARGGHYAMSTPYVVEFLSNATAAPCH